MKYDLKQIFSILGLPLALVAVIVALLAWAGLDAEELGLIAGGLIGVQALGAFTIDALKYAGVVQEGDSGKWSAGFQLVVLVGVAVWMRFFPVFDIHAIDNHALELAKLLGLIFAYITQIIGAKAVHKTAANYGATYVFEG